MTSTETPPVQLVPVTVAQAVNGTECGTIQVMGQPTAVPQLFVTPAMHLDGGYRGGFSLTHAPSGYAVRNGGRPDELMAVAERLAHLDWSFTTPDEFRASPTRAGAREVVREMQFTDPTSIDLPAHDGWGPDGKGDGLKRAAIPHALDVLADMQLCWAKTVGDEAVPLDIPDPSAPRGVRVNPEWTYFCVRGAQNFGIAYLLLALHRVDPVLADSAAAFLADALESGEMTGEWSYEWHEALIKGEPYKLPGIPEFGPLFDA